MARGCVCTHTQTTYVHVQYTYTNHLCPCTIHKPPTTPIPAWVEKHQNHAQEQHPYCNIPQSLRNMNPWIFRQLRSHCCHPLQHSCCILLVHHRLMQRCTDGICCSCVEAMLRTTPRHNGNHAIMRTNKKQCPIVAGLAAHVPCIQEPVRKSLGSLLCATRARSKFINKGNSNLKSSARGCSGAWCLGIGWIGQSDASYQCIHLTQCFVGEEAIRVTYPARSGSCVVGDDDRLP